jgi:beta-glucosidase
MKINANEAGKDFVWGVSTAAYQVEGAHNKDGKGASIWDDFVRTKGKIYKGHDADVSCDFYNHYAQDIALMSQMNIPNFRFSISWSRILPEGTGRLNLKGVDFYNKVIDFCLELGIQPWITLYHWDLPAALEKKGGWANRQIIDWFSNYVQHCVKLFGDRVKHWMILNEPMVFIGAGYFLGVHAPGRKGLNNFLAAAHHAALCQAEGGRIVKLWSPGAKVGTTFSCSLIEPNKPTNKDIAAANRADALINRMFIEPMLGLGYPVKDLPLLNRLAPYIKSNDESRLAFNMDFIGIQNYTREIVAHSYTTPLLWARIIKASKRNVLHTEMDWEVYPKAIHAMLHKFSAYKNVNEIIITENGAAFSDTVVNGEVIDLQRQAYLEDHIGQVLRAKAEGAKVTGYFVWSFMDNFEWAEGFRPRFGLVHVDYETGKRTIKYSGKWYRDFLEECYTPAVFERFSKTATP